MDKQLISFLRHAQENFSSERLYQAKLPWTLDNVRDERLWYVTRNLLQTINPTVLSV